MSTHPLIPMSRRELTALPVFTQLTRRAISQADAAKKLRLSVRQVRRKLRAFRRRGPRSLIHRLRGRPGNHRTPPADRDRILTLLRERYPDFGPTFAAEKLQEEYGLPVHHETLRLWMIEEGLWHPGRGPVPVHLWRERKAAYGELIQCDGSPHRWFEDRGPACTLLAFIDDATSRLPWAAFAAEETTEALMRATWGYLERAGRPLALYADRGKAFSVNIHNAEGDKRTQYARALHELDIELIAARSPQAKGRVERVFGTLQDRLGKELRLRGISTIPEANRFLAEWYLPRHNAKFAVAPQRPADLHRSLKGYDLARIFCVKEERTVRNDLTIQYRTRWFQLAPKQPTIVLPGTVVTVEVGLDGTITLSVRAVRLRAWEIPGPPEREAAVLSPKIVRAPWRPAADHPWRVRIRQDISILQH